MPNFVRPLLSHRHFDHFWVSHFWASRYGQILLIFGWIILASILRFHNLTLKPVWTDEFSTLVFGLGHSFKTLPLNQFMDAAQLLEPNQLTNSTTATDAAHVLLNESNHPPFYFMLTHVWMRLFNGVEDYVSIWGARSLSAVFGILAVPAMYFAGWISFRSRAIAQLAAALMAVSPFGIYLAQEARHYTLTVLWIILSLCCLLTAVQSSAKQKLFPLPVVMAWIIVNGLGIASHYFFLLTLLAEAIALAGMLGFVAWKQENLQVEETSLSIPQNYYSQDYYSKGHYSQNNISEDHLSDNHSPKAHTFRDHQFHDSPMHTYWKSADWRGIGSGIGMRRIGLAVAGTFATIAVWFPYIFEIRQGDALTGWLDAGGWKEWAWINPLLHTAGSITSMVMLLPVQDVDDSTAIASGIILAGLMVILTIVSVRGIQKGLTHPEQQIPLLTLLVFTGAAIVTLLLATYGFGLELAQVFRYHFVYFPAVLLLIAAALVLSENHTISRVQTVETNEPLHIKEHTAAVRSISRISLVIGVLILMGIIGSVTVTTDKGYRKLHRPDRIVKHIVKRYDAPIFIATSHQTHGQTGRLMALAWEMQSPSVSETIGENAVFYLDHRDCTLENFSQCNRPSEALRQTLREYDRPLDVWLLNYEGQANLNRQGCEYQRTERTDGYKAQHYICR